MNNVENEIKTPETLPQANVDANLNQNKVDATLESKPTESQEAPIDPDWKAFREARKRDRAERQAAELKAAQKEAEVQALKAAMEAAFNKQTPSLERNQSFEYTEEETEDQRIEKKVQAAIVAREKQAEQARREQEHQQYPQKLVQNYPDFHHIIAQENLDYLDYHYPEVSRPLQRLGDGFDKWSDIYHAIKKFVPNVATAKKDAARADVNLAKPKSISSHEMTQSGQSSGSAKLSEERKRANWERMQKSLRGLTS